MRMVGVNTSSQFAPAELESTENREAEAQHEEPAVTAAAVKEDKQSTLETPDKLLDAGSRENPVDDPVGSATPQRPSSGEPIALAVLQQLPLEEPPHVEPNEGGGPPQVPSRHHHAMANAFNFEDLARALMNVRPKPLTFSSLDHEDPEKYITKCRTFITAQRLTGEQQVETLQEGLLGEARKWWQPYSEMGFDFEKFFQLLQNKCKKRTRKICSWKRMGLLTAINRNPKSAHPGLIEASDSDVSGLKRLFVLAQLSEQLFLIDTGAEVSVLPATHADGLVPSSFLLHAVNGSDFRTFGKRILSVDLETRFPLGIHVLRRAIPIFGADAIYHFNLLPHLKRGQLINNNTKLAVSGRLAFALVVGISALDKAHPMAHLLARYPQIFSPSAPIGTRATGVFHTL
ncbi:unnamed protein product [Trichogramma brassicae]|uniref:Peptidase A2 domain-containing protein n=1 Tax=Trichogramma brassicae TaxID=86971 RepID=A0A6H5IR35_9HYME|nr:unnamed protein product [Trichogramma brassicae]